MVLERLLGAIPGSQGTKVFVGTALCMGFCGVTFFGAKSQKDGHRLMDSSRPEDVQKGMDKAEEARLSRLISGSGVTKK